MAKKYMYVFLKILEFGFEILRTFYVETLLLYYLYSIKILSIQIEHFIIFINIITITIKVFINYGTNLIQFITSNHLKKLKIELFELL